jgi:hypothetical protein
MAATILTLTEFMFTEQNFVEICYTELHPHFSVTMESMGRNVFIPLTKE